MEVELEMGWSCWGMELEMEMLGWSCRGLKLELELLEDGAVWGMELEMGLLGEWGY